ncbi:MAG: glycosyltransferase family 87 protein [Methylobacter sp.]
MNLSYKYARLFALSYLFIIAVFLSTFEHQIDHQGHPIGTDFLAFWSAGYLANQGAPEKSYQPEQIYQTSKIAVPENKNTYIWSYPPPFFFVTQSLAKLPYLSALTIWSLTGLCGYLFVLYKLHPIPDTFWLSAGFLPAFIDFLEGQNGFLSTILLAGALYNLTNRPVIAGILIGLLSYKPQLGLIIPLALLAGRHYLVFTSAATTVLAINALAFQSFGLATYQAFFHNLENAHALVDQGLLPLYKMPSFFAAMRFLGIPSTIALSFHILIGLAVTIITVYVWRKSLFLELKISTLILASLIVPHHLNDYDLTLLMIPIVLLTKNAVTNGWLKNEKIILSLAWFIPLMIVIGYTFLNIQIGPLLIFALFLFSAWRTHTLQPLHKI